MNNNNSCFWAVAIMVSAAIAAIFLVLFIFALLPAADIAIWILAAVSALLLLILVIKAPSPVPGWLTAPMIAPAPAPAAPAQCGCCCPKHTNCCVRWVGALAGTIAAVGFGAAFLAAALVPVVAEVFFFLAIMAFVLAVILLVSYASCKCEQAR